MGLTCTRTLGSVRALSFRSHHKVHTETGTFQEGLVRFCRVFQFPDPVSCGPRHAHIALPVKFCTRIPPRDMLIVIYTKTSCRVVPLYLPKLGDSTWQLKQSTRLGWQSRGQCQILGLAES